MNSGKIIYFDNAAAAPVSDVHLDFYKDCLQKYYCNQEAAHEYARETRKEINRAAGRILETLTGTENGNLLWTNCGTDAIEAVLSMPALSGRRIVSTKAEHACIDAALKRRKDCEIHFAGIKPDGQIDFEEFKNLLNPQTALVAVHHVQSETGAVQDLGKVRELIDERSPGAKLLTDSIQAAGKIPFDYQEAHPDFMVLSGRKIGAPGGGALLYKDSKLEAYFKKLRQTEHRLCRIEPSLCLTLEKCLTDSCRTSSPRYSEALELNRKLRNALGSIEIKGVRPVKFTLSAETSSPYILHFTVQPFQGAILLRMLSQHNIMAAAGSACDAETKTPGKVLLAMGMKKDKAFSALRLSFRDTAAEADCDIFIDKFTEILREY